MGRAKAPNKLIECPKSRNSTFMKRRKGLLKKAYEFATLCGVDVCLICFGPQGDRHYEPEIWPNDMSEVGRIVRRYRSLSKDEQCRRQLDLSGFIEQRKKKLEDELKQRIRETENGMYPSWDDRLNEWPADKLQDLLATLDSNLERVNRKIEFKKYIDINHSSHGKEIVVANPPQTYPNHEGMLDMYEMMDSDESMMIQPVPLATSYFKPLDKSYMPMQLPYIPNTPNYGFSNFSAANNNMLSPPVMGYYVNPGIGTSNPNMFHSQNELYNTESMQHLMQFQSNFENSPSSSNLNSGSVHGRTVHQTHHVNHGFSDFQMIQKRERQY